MSKLHAIDVNNIWSTVQLDHESSLPITAVGSLPLTWNGNLPYLSLSAPPVCSYHSTSIASVVSRLQIACRQVSNWNDCLKLTNYYEF